MEFETDRHDGTPPTVEHSTGDISVSEPSIGETVTPYTDAHDATAFNKGAKVPAPYQILMDGVEHLFDAAIVIVDSELRLTYCNALALELFEFPNGMLDKNMDMREVITFMAERGDFGPGNPDDFIALTDIALTAAKSPKKGKHQSYLNMPSGKVLRVTVVSTEEQNFLISAYDTSIQKQKNDVLDMALEIGCSGFWVVSNDGSNMAIHSKYLQSVLTPRELQMIEDQGIWPLFHADDLPRAEQLWRDVTEFGRGQEGTVRIMTHRQGVRWMRFHLHPQRVENGPRTGVICFFTDTTDTLRQQEDLRKAKHNAEESLKAKNNFLARMSHEIRTPMNGVIGIADALIHHHSDPAINPKLELIQSSAANILKILDETLDHTKLESEVFKLNPMQASPTKVVRDVCSLWEQQALKNGAFIRCVIKPNVPDMLVFDKFRYEQCVNNLLSNAVKFTPKGQIDVVLTTVETPGRPPRLVLAVRDSGIGMTAEQQQHIFEAYAQGDKSISSRYGGTGLGLNISKQIIELMGGTISVKSKIGEGTTFALSFPIDAQDVSVDKAETGQSSHGLVDQMLQDAKPEPTAYEKLRLLVVDDNATNHMVINSLLESLVAEIYTAKNGQEALDILDMTEIDIVLMDIHMPVMDGIEATIAIRSSKKPYKDVQIIALTADPQYQQKKLCMNIGMDEALAKPVKLNDVLQAIDNVLGDRASDSQAA